MKIGIIKFSTTNLFSIKSACDYYSLDSIISNSSKELSKADALILPGVGSFKSAMNFLKENNLLDLINEFNFKQKKIMGICLGFQILFSESEEFGKSNGLNLISGKVKSIPYQKKLNQKKIHTGWNKILLQKQSKIISKSDSENFYYFTHSFYAQTSNTHAVLTNSLFNNFSFCSSIEHENLFGCQFHPEKSGKEGIKIYYNFLKD